MFEQYLLLSLFCTVSFLSVIPTTSAFVASPPRPPPTKTVLCSRSMTQLNLYRLVQEAISEAQLICAVDPNSPECKVAWDIVEELEAADSHTRQDHELSQPAAAARSSSNDFVALLGGFDILSQKVDLKMDQLIATCEKLDAMGADPSVTELSQLAEQMKRGLEYVSNKLRE